MAYASTAGVPSVYGLYGAFLPCMVYGLVGSSRQLAVGPVAVTSPYQHATGTSHTVPQVRCNCACTCLMCARHPQRQLAYNHSHTPLGFQQACTLCTSKELHVVSGMTRHLLHAGTSPATTIQKAMCRSRVRSSTTEQPFSWRF